MRHSRIISAQTRLPVFLALLGFRLAASATGALGSAPYYHPQIIIAAPSPINLKNGRIALRSITISITYLLRRTVPEGCRETSPLLNTIIFVADCGNKNFRIGDTFNPLTFNYNVARLYQIQEKHLEREISIDIVSVYSPPYFLSREPELSRFLLISKIIRITRPISNAITA